MSDRIAEEGAAQATELAMQIMSSLEMDGNDTAVIFSIFAIGSAICAQLNGLEKEKYLYGCDKFYEETTRFLKDIGISEGEDES
jgi:hypothetical protein